MAKRKLQVEITGDASSLERAFGRASRAGSGFGRDLAKYGGIAAAAVGAAGVAAFKMSNDFQSSMEKIVGLVGVSQKQVDAWSSDLLTLGPQLGKSPKELADALFFITSAGLRGKTALDALKASAKASAAGLGETQTVADAVTSAMNAYGAKTLSAAKATDVLVATVREGKVEPDQLAGVLGRILPLASNLGVSFNQVGAAMASMTRVGLDANTAATGLRAIFSQLTKVTPQTAKELATVGLSAEGLRKELREKGLLALMETLQTTFHGNVAAMSKVFPNIRALTGFMAQMGSQTSSTAGIFKRMQDTTGSLDDAFAAAQKTGAFQLQQAFAGLKSFAVIAGGEIAKLAGPALSGLSRGMVAALPTVERLASGFGDRLAPAIAGVRDFLDRALQPSLGAVSGFIQTTVIPIAQQFGAIFVDAVSRVGAVVQKHMPEIRTIIGNVGAILKDIWAVQLPLLRFAFAVVLPAALRIAIPVLEVATGTIRTVADTLRTVIVWVENAAGALGRLPGRIRSAFAAAGGAIASALKAPINAVIGLIDSIRIPGFTVDLPSINVFGHKIGGGSFGWGGTGPLFHIPTLAAGGIVTQPTLAMVGEAGPEAVVPLDAAAFAGRPIILAPQVTVQGSVVTEDELMLAVRRGLQRIAAGLPDGYDLFRTSAT